MDTVINNKEAFKPYAHIIIHIIQLSTENNISHSICIMNKSAKTKTLFSQF